MSPLGLAVLLALASLREETNRLWIVELELAGPCEEIVIDCGADGSTRLVGPFLSGEERRLALPVPLRVPLGGASLGALPLPAARVLPAGSSGSARVLSFVSEQPGELQGSVRGLLAATRPPVAAATVRARASAFLGLAAAFVLGLAARRRALVQAGLLGAGAVACFLLGSRSQERAEPVRVLEADLELPSALLVTGAREEIELGSARVEVVPEGSALALVLAQDLSGSARASGASLYALESVSPPRLAPTSNDHAPLSDVWIRRASGEWTFHGEWPRGAPLPSERSGSPPPGWLASGLPQGRTCLLARAASGEWLRFRGGPGSGGPGGD